MTTSFDPSEANAIQSSLIDSVVGMGGVGDVYLGHLSSDSTANADLDAKGTIFAPI